MKRWVVLLCVFLFAFSIATPEYEMHRLINGARSDTLTVTEFLKDYANTHAIRMANRGYIYHDPCSGCAEIVGVIPGARTPWNIFNEWMESPLHRAIILDPTHTRMGCAQVNRDGFDWWVCEFR